MLGWVTQHQSGKGKAVIYLGVGCSSWKMCSWKPERKGWGKLTDKRWEREEEINWHLLMWISISTVLHAGSTGWCRERGTEPRGQEFNRLSSTRLQSPSVSPLSQGGKKSWSSPSYCCQQEKNPLRSESPLEMWDPILMGFLFICQGHAASECGSRWQGQGAGCVHPTGLSSSKLSVLQAQLLSNWPRPQQLQDLPEHGVHHIQVPGHRGVRLCGARKLRAHRTLAHTLLDAES